MMVRHLILAALLLTQAAHAFSFPNWPSPFSEALAARGGGPRGYANSSISFDGVNEYITLGTPSVLIPERTDSFSFSVWFILTAEAASQIIFSNQFAGDFRGISFGLVGSGVESVRLQLRNDNSPDNRLDVQTSTEFSKNTWHHVVVTYDGTSTPGGILIYYDSVSQAKTTIANTLSGTIVGSTEVDIGRSAAQGLYWPGNLCHFSYWNKALSVSEVGEIWNRGKTTNLLNHSAVANLGPWYKLGDGDSLTTASGVLDSSGQGNHGTATNMEAADIQVGVTP